MTLINMVDAEMIPPEAKPPKNVYQDPSSLYPSWLNSLPEHIKIAILPYLVECDLSEQLNKAGKGWGWDPSVPHQSL